MAATEPPPKISPNHSPKVDFRALYARDMTLFPQELVCGGIARERCRRFSRRPGNGFVVARKKGRAAEPAAQVQGGMPFVMAPVTISTTSAMYPG